MGEWSDVFDAEVLPLLNPAATRALLGRDGQECRDPVLRSPKLECTGRSAGVKLRVIVSPHPMGTHALAPTHTSRCPRFLLGRFSMAVQDDARRRRTDWCGPERQRDVRR